MSKVTIIARNLRQRHTEAERLLWSRLRGRRLVGLKFRRQHPIAGFVADFACVDHGLVVEVDGGQHDPDVDATRTLALATAGFRVLRVWNNDVLDNLDGVMRTIAAACGSEV